MYDVKREWREWVFLVSKEVIKKIVLDKCKETIHCFIQSWFMIWADRSIEDFNNFIDNWEDWIDIDRIAIVIPSQMWHAIAIPMDKLYLFDVWEISKDELNIID